MPVEATDATFDHEVLESEGKVIVDFWAEWCGPCHAVAPVLDRIADEHDLKIVKVEHRPRAGPRAALRRRLDPDDGAVRERRAAGVGGRRDAEGRARARARARRTQSRPEHRSGLSTGATGGMRRRRGATTYPAGLMRQRLGRALDTRLMRDR